MGVLGEVGTIAGGLALKIHGADEAAFGECFKTVIDGGERNGGHLAARAGVDFLSGGMIALVQQDRKNLLALFGGAQAGTLERIFEQGLIFGVELHF